MGFDKIQFEYKVSSVRVEPLSPEADADVLRTPDVGTNDDGAAISDD